MRVKALLVSLVFVMLATDRAQAQIYWPFGDSSPQTNEANPKADVPTPPRQARSVQRAKAVPKPKYEASPDASDRIVERINAGVVSLISGGADGTYIRIASEMASVLDNTDQLRILPIVGRGSLQNLKDILYLKGIDIGIVQMDAREGLKSEGMFEEAQNQIRYITRLYNEEVHLIASRDIKDVRQLDGKKVNIDKPGSGTNLTAQILFEKLGVKPQFTTYDQVAAYEQLRSGEIQAAIFVAGRPARAVTEFDPDGRFQLLSIPFEGAIEETYLPARLTAKDYPRLIGTNNPIDTVAVGNVLAVYNMPETSDRYKRIERFIEAFFTRFDEFQKSERHPKWREVNLTATVPGWKRYKPAQEWLDRNGEKAASAPSDSEQEKEFQIFIDKRSDKRAANLPEDRARLFQEFMAWRDGKGKSGKIVR